MKCRRTMTVEIEHVPRQTETVLDITSNPDDDDDVVSEKDTHQGTMYQVEREIVATEEQYIVTTKDGMGKMVTTYWVEENDDGDWEVTKRRKSPNRGHPTVKERGDLSTETVREALREQAGIEVVN